jgi:hypothetical protein
MVAKPDEHKGPKLVPGGRGNCIHARLLDRLDDLRDEDPECRCPGPRGYTEHVYLVVETREGLSVVLPELLGKLRQYAFGRKRDDQLLGAMRTRAVEWCKAEHLNGWQSDIAVTGTVGLGMLPSTQETLAMSLVDRACRSPPFPHALQ